MTTTTPTRLGERKFGFLDAISTRVYTICFKRFLLLLRAKGFLRGSDKTKVIFFLSYLALKKYYSCFLT